MTGLDAAPATGAQPQMAPTPRPQTRRALLAGLLGGVGTWVAGAAAKASPARAAAGSSLIIGSSTNNAGNSNTILTTHSSVVGFEVIQNGPGTAMMGLVKPGTGTTRGVYGRSDSPDGDGVQARNAGTAASGAAIRAFGGQNHGIVTMTDNGERVAVEALTGTTEPTATVSGAQAIYAESAGVSGTGLVGISSATTGFGRGVYGEVSSANGAGVVGSSAFGVGVMAIAAGGTKELAALRASNGNGSDGLAAYFNNISASPTAHLYNQSSGQVLWLQNGGTDADGAGGGDFIVCRNNSQADIQFRVATDGTAFSDTSFNGGGADFAELMSAAGSTEPGDVLAVRSDGRLERSATARQASVVGVHSTRPGFVGGSSVDGRAAEGRIPVAVVGIVPVKASAENGSIRAGDRLVSAATPGHAMRSDAHPEVGTVIGKALSALTSGIGTIDMLVMLQ